FPVQATSASTPAATSIFTTPRSTTLYAPASTTSTPVATNHRARLRLHPEHQPSAHRHDHTPRHAHHCRPLASRQHAHRVQHAAPPSAPVLTASTIYSSGSTLTSAFTSRLPASATPHTSTTLPPSSSDTPTPTPTATATATSDTPTPTPTATATATTTLPPSSVRTPAPSSTPATTEAT
ncbi:mucin-7-like, partial [Ovis canadensis]|uniref:mucin-7-like n=1 Tax=Ovis canadensis TaxID=37174 RepID=UPI0038B573CA